MHVCGFISNSCREPVMSLGILLSLVRERDCRMGFAVLCYTELSENGSHCVCVCVCMWRVVFKASVEMCIHEIAARQCEMIAVNKTFSIEVIKMIEDSSELIHLWARWWGTFCTCGYLGESASVCSFICASVCVFSCHRCRTTCEMGLAWRRPERCGAMPTGGPCLFTVHLKRQPNIYHHPTTAYIRWFNLTFIKTK